MLDYSEEAFANYTYEYYVEPDEDDKSEDALDAKNEETAAAEPKKDITTQTTDAANDTSTSQDPFTEIVPEEPPEPSAAEKKAAYEKK